MSCLIYCSAFSDVLTHILLGNFNRFVTESTCRSYSWNWKLSKVTAVCLLHCTLTQKGSLSNKIPKKNTTQLVSFRDCANWARSVSPSIMNRSRARERERSNMQQRHLLARLPSARWFLLLFLKIELPATPSSLLLLPSNISSIQAEKFQKTCALLKENQWTISGKTFAKGVCDVNTFFAIWFSINQWWFLWFILSFNKKNQVIFTNWPS